MSAATADVVPVRVPGRTWRSEARAVRVVWHRELIRSFMRRLVSDHLDASQTAQTTLAPGVSWFGWGVPPILQAGMVLALGLAMLAVAIRWFGRTE